MTDGLMTASEAAREISRRLGVTIAPSRISSLFYTRKVAEEIAPIVGGRRLFRRETLDVIQGYLVTQMKNHNQGVSID